jgi:MFS family permease
MWIGIYLWVVHAGSYLRGYFWRLMSALVQTIVGDVIPFERRGRAMGIVMTSFSLSTVVGVPLGLYTTARWGWLMARDPQGQVSNYWVAAVVGGSTSLLATVVASRLDLRQPISN